MRWGRFELGSEIGGGHAHVLYDAEDTERSQRVAVMRPRDVFTLNAGECEQFDREARALAAIRHPGLIQILEHGEIEGSPFMVLAPVSGRTFGALIRCGERPDPVALCASLATVADGLHALHSAGVIVESAPPSSITLTPTGEGVLHEFGLACPLYRITQRSTDAHALGKPLQLSPEQILCNRRSITAATDVHAVGYTLYECLTGHPPFRTDDLQELVRMILQKKPRAPHRVDRSVPRAVSRVASRCLAKDPRDRYATAANLATALRTAFR